MQDFNKPLWHLTVGEFVELLDSKLVVPKPEEQVEETINKNLVYGLDGLARILGCSKNHVSKLKRTGMFDEAIIQKGRKIIVDADKALKLFGENP